MVKSNHCHSEGQNLKNRLFAILSKTGLRCILGASRFGAISLLQQDSDAPRSIRELLDSTGRRFNSLSSTDKSMVLDSTVRSKENSWIGQQSASRPIDIKGLSSLVNLKTLNMHQSWIFLFYTCIVLIDSCYRCVIPRFCKCYTHLLYVLYL